MTAASDELVRVHTENGVATVTLNQPERRNSLSMALLEALSEVLEQIAGDGSVRVVVLAAAGKVFCAGHDLREMRDQFDSHDFQLRLFQQCSKVMQQIVNLPKPVIARVAGVATAAGCQLVASCDLAVAEKGARFATPGVNIGLFCSTPMVALSRNVSRKHAMEMLLTGELIDAAEWYPESDADLTDRDLLAAVRRAEREEDLQQVLQRLRAGSVHLNIRPFQHSNL